MLTEIGARLKEAREAKGYTLNDLQEITKIQKRYLVGIENGDYESIPGAFYVRAFIRQYADAVGLNPDELLETYKNEVPNAPSVEATTTIAPQRQKRNKMSSTTTQRTMQSMPKIIVGLFILVIVIVMIYMLVQKLNANAPEEQGEQNALEFKETTPKEEPKKPVKEEEEQEETSTEDDTTVEDKEETTEQKDKEQEDKAKEEKDKKDKDKNQEQQIVADEAQSGGNTTVYNVTGAEEMDLALTFTGDAWIEVRDANTRQTLLDNEGKVYTSGEEIKLDGVTAQSVAIVVGNIQTTKITINEQAVEYVRQGYPQNIVLKIAQ